MALAEKVGRSEAHRIVEAASHKAITARQHLHDVLSADTRVTAHLGADKLKSLFEPMAYQGASQELIDRLLASLGTD